jgi:hypothetical protein
MAMNSRTKQLLCFAAGVVVGVATTSIGEILMLVARRPSSGATHADEPAPPLDTPTADVRPAVRPSHEANAGPGYESVGATALSAWRD